MDIDKLFNVDQVPDALFDSVNNTVSEARAMQKKKAAENAQAVIQALQKMKGDLEGKYDSVYSMLESRIASIQDGRDGIDGRDGVNGRDGKNGKDGLAGRDGRDGVDGINGLDGADGISIADIRLDFDNSLVITLSNGREINAGEILPPDITDRLKVIINQGASGGGGSGGSLPDQTGNSGKFLTTDGSAASWATVSGSGDVVGPASATDNAITRFDNTTGKLLQNSLVTVSDAGAITAPQVGSVIPFYYANQAAFPSAATYHGAVAHSHSDAAMYFAHSSAWVRMLDANTNVTVAQGGTGQTSFTDGQLLIGNSTGNTLTKATLTAGTNISITNAAGAITIAASGGGSSNILENDQVIASNYTISSAKNGLSVGPVTVNTGIAVTVGTGQKWLVLN